MSKEIEFREIEHLAQPASWPYKPEQLLINTQFKCSSDDGDEMCETCNCWKKTREMCS